VVLFRLLLDISYITFVNPIYEYSGFTYNFSLSGYFLSWMLFLISFEFLKTRLTKVSEYFFITAVLAVFAPLTSLYGLDSTKDVSVVCIVLIALFIVYYITRIKLVSFKKIPCVKGGLNIVIVICSVFVIFLLGWYFISGARFNLNLLKVYEFRANNAVLSGGGILNYTNNWTLKVFNVTLFSIALMYRRYFLCISIFLVQICFYAFSAHKSILFLPFLIFGIWYYFRKTNSLLVVPLMFCGVIITTLLSYHLFGDTLIASLFSRRVFFVPANLTFVYFDFFSLNPFVFWSNSIFSSFINYPYDLSLAHVVGRFLGKPAMWANNGFIASGYAHAGLFGVFIYAVTIGFVLRFINDVTYKLLPVWFAVALSIIPLRSLLISSDLFTVMLTHGFIVVLIIIFFARSKKYAVH